MTWQNITYFISIIIAAAVMGFIAWYARKNRNVVAGGALFMWISFLVSLLSIFQGISMFSPSMEQALFWFNLRFVSLAAIPVLWLVFVLYFIEKPGLVSRPRIAVLFVIPAITQIMLWTNDIHHLWVVHDVVIRQAGPFFIPVTAARVPGPWMMVHNIYGYGMLMAGVVILFASLARLYRRYRGQAVTLGAGSLIMIIGTLFPTFNLVPGMILNPLPQGFALGSLVIAWGLYRHRFLGETPLIDREKQIPATLVTLFAVLTVGIIIAGFVYYSQYREHQQASVREELSSIADLKVNELLQWRKERIGDGNMLYGNVVFQGMAMRFLADPADAGARWGLESWLGSIQSSYRYHHVQLFDARGSLRLTVPRGPSLFCGNLMHHLDEIRQSGKVEIIDFHRDAPDGPIHLSVIVPVTGGVPGGVPAGFVVLFIDPAVYIYPLISRWPTPSKTAEIQLVRRDGNDALFLNELRFRKNTALNLRMPLKDLRIPAFRAALGREGYMEGIDYRGKPVASVVRAVPGSPWFMVARIGMDEVYAPVRERFLVMVIAIVVLIAGTGAGVGLLWRRQGERFIRERLEAAEALRESEEKFSSAFKSSPYAITITRPEDGRIIEVNDAFSTITGYTREEALESSTIGLDLWVSREDRNEVVRDLMNRGKAVGREFQFKKKNGDIINGLFAADVITLKNGRFILSSINDITDRKRAEEHIRALLSEKELLLKEVHHRIKNNMALIANLLSLQASRLSEPDGIKALNESRGRVMGMAVMYDLLFGTSDFRYVSVPEYVGRIMRGITASLPAIAGVKLENRADDFVMDSKVLFPVGIIINELVTNAYKYAYPDGQRGTIAVSVSRLPENRVDITVCDDGVGIPESFDCNSQSGFGMKLVNLLVKQIEGTLECVREGGTLFRINFQYDDPHPGQAVG